MTRIYRILASYILFFVLYIGAGLYDQFFSVTDFYPFSDWYLYSYVNQYGEIYDLKYSVSSEVKYLMQTAPETHKNKIADQLERAASLRSRGEISQSQMVLQNLARRYEIQGSAALVVRKIERMQYYKNQTWIEENEFALSAL